jgi:hypothetical protein
MTTTFTTTSRVPLNVAHKNKPHIYIFWRQAFINTGVLHHGHLDSVRSTPLRTNDDARAQGRRGACLEALKQLCMCVADILLQYFFEPLQQQGVETRPLAALSGSNIQRTIF